MTAPTAPVPQFFDCAGGPAFGVYYPPSTSSSSGTSVLICGPLGAEVGYTQRVLRVLSQRFADKGFPVLRVDLPGCGDSAGEESDFTPQHGVDCLRKARALLLERSGRPRLACIGLRHGALAVLTTAADTAGFADELMVWDPSGVRELEGLVAGAKTPTVLVDSNGRLQAEIAQGNVGELLRGLRMIRNDMQPWFPERKDFNVTVPGPLLLSIVAHGASHW
jgi:pimeloyl-ACP methyl ester carboxylesterase